MNNKDLTTLEQEILEEFRDEFLVEDKNGIYHVSDKYYVVETFLMDVIQRVQEKTTERVKENAEIVSKKYCLIGDGLDDCNSCLPIQRLLEALEKGSPTNSEDK